MLLTASDKKIPYSSNGTTVDYYNADIISATDYSTFGAISRSFNAGLATNAFDGQRLSPEISTNAQTAQFWEYNGDVGRRWNIDKVYKNSPYEVFGSNPILFSDPSGLDTVTESKKAGTNDVFQHHNGSSNFYWDKTAKGWEGGGESGNLAEVKITARLKKDLPPLNFMTQVFSYSKEDVMGYKLNYSNFEKGDYTGLTSTQLSMYKMRDESRESWKMMSLGAVGMLAAPALPEIGAGLSGTPYLSSLFEGALVSRTASAGADITIQSAIQLGENGNISFNRYNLTSIGANFLMPGKVFTSAFIGSAAEYSAKSGFNNSLFGQKTIGTVTYQTLIYGAFGKAGEAGDNLMIKYGVGKFGANYSTGILSNTISGVSSEIKSMQDENNK